MKKGKFFALIFVLAACACLMITGCGSSGTDDGSAGSSGQSAASTSTSTEEPSAAEPQVEEQTPEQAQLMEDYLQAWKNEEWDKASEIAGKLPEKAEESCVGTMTDAQKKAYREVVEKYPVELGADAADKPFLWGYYLTDVTNDGVCDLIVDYGTCEADRMCTVYTYLEDELFKYQETGSSHAVMGAYPNQDGFIVMTGHMGYETLTVACKADRESLEFPTFEAGDKDYVPIPYMLDPHISYETENAELDMSPLE